MPYLLRQTSAFPVASDLLHKVPYNSESWSGIRILRNQNYCKIQLSNAFFQKMIRIKCTFCVLGRPGVRNAIFAPAKFNSYAGSAFPGISDLLHEIDDLDEESKSARWKEIRRHLSDLMIMIQEAERFLRPVAQV